MSLRDRSVRMSRSRRNARRRLFLEQLEDRRVLATYTWNVNGGGDWTDQNNWFNNTTGLAANGIPNAIDDVAIFTTVGAANTNAIVIPDATTITIGSLRFNTTLANEIYTISSAGSGKLVFDVSAGNATTQKNAGGLGTVNDTITVRPRSTIPSTARATARSFPSTV